MSTNTIKTYTLLAGLAGLAVVVGGLLAGTSGLFLGLLLGLGIVGASYWFSDRIALRAAGAHPVTEADAPGLLAMVRTLADRAGMPAPTVAVSPALQPNAFATGRNEQRAVVCVTQGLLQMLPPDELEAVLAHELGHIRNRDILIGSVAAAIATGISYIAQLAMFTSIFGSDDDGPNPVGVLAFALLAPVAAMFIQFAISRSREFEADRFGAELVGRGEPLARALQRIESTATRVPMAVNPAQASAWIHNPLAGEQPGGRRPRQRQPNVTKLFSTHPPTSERIARLRAFDAQRLVG
ncbi:MAG: M48 family metalloprotease [Acidimicrobiales bacterium]|nr:M48 family metalloprotease [Acidimicrobiales bacterium]